MKTVPVVLCCCAFALIVARSTAVALPVVTERQDEITDESVVPVSTPTESFTETTTETTIETTIGTTTETMTETTTESTPETTIENTEPVSVAETTEPSTTTTEPSTTTTEMPTTTTELPTTTTELPTTTNEVSDDKSTPEEVVKDKLSEQIRKILKHYQKPDPTGFPGAPIPDPLSIPKMKKSFGLAEMTFFNMTVHGLSKFKVERVTTDLKNMQVYVLLKIKRMYVFGNYTLKMMFTRPSAGPFNVTLIDVDTAATAALEPDGDGVLQAAETEMDMRFKDCELDFKNLGMAGSMFQSVISTAGSVLFEGIKPFIIGEVNSNMRADVNAQVKAITSKLPKMELPVPDMAVAEGRAYVRRMGYDPYHVADHHIKQGPVDFTVTDLYVSGLSDFRRVGDIGLQIQGPVIQMSVHVITNRVHGTLRWAYQVSMAKNYGRSGVSNFTVDHIQVRAVVNQTLDIRNKPTLDDLEIEVGKVVVNMERQEPLDYVIEMAVNSLPDLLRHLIVDVLEEPIKVKVQTILDDVQVEKMVEERLPELDRLAGQ